MTLFQISLTQCGLLRNKPTYKHTQYITTEVPLFPPQWHPLHERKRMGPFLWWHPKLSHVYDTTIKETNSHSCGQIQFRGRALFPSRWHTTFICFFFFFSSSSGDGNGTTCLLSLFPWCRIHPLRIPKVIVFFLFPLPFSRLISSFANVFLVGLGE